MPLPYLPFSSVEVKFGSSQRENLPISYAAVSLRWFDSLTIADICRLFRATSNSAMERCFQNFPCLVDPARRSSFCVRLALAMIHLVFAGILFLFDGDVIEKTRNEPWYTASYLLLFSVTLILYFATSISSPGNVLDAMRAVNEKDVLFRNVSTTSGQPASSTNGHFIVTMDGGWIGNNYSRSNGTSWSKLVKELYPPGAAVKSWTCRYCNIEQPPRAKHCHDCRKCVLKFDHHCVFLGNCVGHGNHRRFWCYLLGETALCLWTGILYISYLTEHITRVWWKDAIMILLSITLSICFIFLLPLLLFHSYLVLTNQTTFEIVRRKRIPYLRGLPHRVHPFSRGACRNLYNFCCASSSVYSMEPMPTPEEIEIKSMPYTCCDVVTCRCCC